MKVTREINNLETLLTMTKAKVALVRDIFVNGDPDLTEGGYNGLFYLMWDLGDDLDFLSKKVDLHPEWKEKLKNAGNGKNGKKEKGAVTEKGGTHG